jgi:fatty-acyl-CoA synthase
MRSTRNWNFADVWNGVAREVPERDAIVCGAQNRTWREFADRSVLLASALFERGVRAGDTVAIDLTNRPEYLETFFAALQLGAAPVNINYRYVAEEVSYVLDDAGARALVYEPRTAEAVETATGQIAADTRPTLLRVGDSYEEAISDATPDTAGLKRRPTGDDLILLYTGGTTGMPKGVMWRNDDLYRALWDMGRPGTEPRDPFSAARAGKRAGTCLPACPLMHGAGLFVALSALAGAGTVVLSEGAGLDAERIWDDVMANEVEVLTIAGDAFALPLLAALEAEPARWELSSLRAITSSGMTWSPETKAAMLRHLPGVTLIDSLGASEGMIARSVSDAASAIKPACFAVNDRFRVVDEHSGVTLAPGSNAVGLLAVSGNIPVGYWNDPVRTASTFRVVDGVRYSVAGDYATVEADGTIRLLGRGSACVNTGGEKVYPEEVELVLRGHPAVLDCVIVGVPDNRFGEVVVALVQAAPDSGLSEAALGAWCKQRLAGFKRPRRFVLLDSLERSAAGKADYLRLRELAAANITSE